MPRTSNEKYIKAAPSLKNVNKGAVPSIYFLRDGTVGQYFLLKIKE